MPAVATTRRSDPAAANATQKWVDAWLRHNHNTARTEAAIGQAVASLHFPWDPSHAERTTKAWIRACVAELKRQLTTVYVVSRRNAATFLRSTVPLKIREDTGPDPNLIPNPNPLEAASLVDQLWQKGSWAWGSSLIANDAALSRFTTQQVAKAKGIIQQGVGDGLTPAELASKLEDQMQTPHNWTRIARTEVARVNNQALQDSFALNQDLMAGQQFIATLDTSTCPVCGSYDGRAYYYHPVAGQVPIQVMPQAPLHPNCRCVLSPIMKSAEDLAAEIGVPVDVLPPELDGQPTPRQSYTDWLKTQPEATQKKALTPQQFELFQQGVTIDQMTTGGKTMEPEELAKVEPGEIADVQAAEKLKTELSSEEVAKDAPGTVDTANSPTPLASKAGVEKIELVEKAKPVQATPTTPAVPPSPPPAPAPVALKPSPEEYVETGSTKKGYAFRKKADGSYEIRTSKAWVAATLNAKGELETEAGVVVGKPTYIGWKKQETPVPVPIPPKAEVPQPKPTPTPTPTPTPPMPPPLAATKVPASSVGWGGPGAGQLPSATVSQSDAWWARRIKADKNTKTGMSLWSGSAYSDFRKMERLGGASFIAEYEALPVAERQKFIQSKGFGFDASQFESYARGYKAFRQAVAQAPRYHGAVHRGVSLQAEFFEQYTKVGNEITSNCLDSWSRNPDIASGFSKKGGGKAVVFHMHTTMGTNISGVSLYEHEQEVLMPKGVKFKVLRTKKVDRQTHVFLEELTEASKFAEARRQYVPVDSIGEPTGDRWTNMADWSVNGHFPMQEGHLTGDKKRTIRRYRATDNVWAKHSARFWEENPKQIAERLRNWEHDPIPCVRVRGPGAPKEWPTRWVQVVVTKDGFAEVVSPQKRPGAFPVQVHPRYANDGMDDAMRKFLLPFAPRCPLHGPKVPQWKRGNLVCFACPCGQQKEFL